MAGPAMKTARARNSWQCARIEIARASAHIWITDQHGFAAVHHRRVAAEVERSPSTVAHHASTDELRRMAALIIVVTVDDDHIAYREAACYLERRNVSIADAHRIAALEFPGIGDG